MPPRILAVSGSTNPSSRTRVLLDVAAGAARDAGAEVRLLDLAETLLPLFRESDGTQAALPEVLRLRADAAWAQGFLLATPEYHGNLSGALKNWFDFLWKELAGKLAGVVATTGGGWGDMSVQAIRASFQWCMGFALPLHAAARPEDFDGATLRPGRTRDRVERIGRDVARYAPLLHDAFDSARRLGPSVASGFAGLAG